MNSEVKLCIDCKFFRRNEVFIDHRLNWRRLKVEEVIHPDAIRCGKCVSPDPDNGDRHDFLVGGTVVGTYCSARRVYTCGPKAKYFQPKATERAKEKAV